MPPPRLPTYTLSHFFCLAVESQSFHTSSTRARWRSRNSGVLESPNPVHSAQWQDDGPSAPGQPLVKNPSTSYRELISRIMAGICSVKYAEYMQVLYSHADWSCRRGEPSAAR